MASFFCEVFIHSEEEKCSGEGRRALCYPLSCEQYVEAFGPFASSVEAHVLRRIAGWAAADPNWATTMFVSLREICKNGTANIGLCSFAIGPTFHRLWYQQSNENGDSKFKFKNLELLFTTLFKFSSYYSNSWHYSKYQVLFNFGI